MSSPPTLSAESRAGAEPRVVPPGPSVARAAEADSEARIAVVIPCYKVKKHIRGVVDAIGPWAFAVYCVDDKCPDGSGKFIEETFVDDSRVQVVFRERNGGVGAATMTGYRAAIEAGADVVIKIDGDGQMDPRLGPELAKPILSGEADYVKGNRFFDAQTVAAMPFVRLVGNAGLSFLTKLSTGYWSLFDATNGFTALHAKVANEIPFDKTHPRYFFESDLLFRLSVMQAKVVEVPLMAVYQDEKSNLSELKALFTFPVLHARNFSKRVLYNYFLRGFGPASLTLLAGLALLAFGIAFGVFAWVESSRTGVPASAGTVMLAALPTLAGFQFLLTFGILDILSAPRTALHHRIYAVKTLKQSGTARAE